MPFHPIDWIKMKAKTLAMMTIWVVFISASFSEDLSISAVPPTQQEVKNLSIALRLPDLFKRAHSSDFKLSSTRGSHISYLGSQHQWRTIKKQTQDLLARPEGPYTGVLKLMAEFESRVDDKDSDGMAQFLLNFEKEWNWEMSIGQ